MSLDWNDIAQSGFDAGLFAANATNRLYRTSNSGTFNSLLSWSALYGEPRMYGLRLRYRFGADRVGCLPSPSQWFVRRAAVVELSGNVDLDGVAEFPAARPCD